MPEGQKYIYYASGESIDRIEKLPQTERVADKGYEILYFTEEIDEFAAKVLASYKDKEFKSVSSGDLGIEADESEKQAAEDSENKALFEKMKEILGDKVKEVKPSQRLKSHPVCFSSEGEITIEMEKTLKTMPNGQDIKADKILEININHDVFPPLKEAYDKDQEKLKLFTNLLYNQALLIEGLPVNDPVEFTNDICKIMAS
jgi:molecular chaperone HtpG